MSERPILFSSEMVRAILDGRKTQTRRVIKPQPIDIDRIGGTFAASWNEKTAEVYEPFACKYGIAGDRLWVREAWRCFGGREYEYQQHQPSIRYRATEELTGPDYGLGQQWRPSIHMPRWASRITLEITNIRVERVQDISQQDAACEGVDFVNTGDFVTPFATLWDSINATRDGGKFAWTANPWVWVIEFRRAT